jgi:hypothetical protein
MKCHRPNSDVGSSSSFIKLIETFIARFQFVITENILKQQPYKNTIFWDINQCSPLKVNSELCLPPAFVLISCSGYSLTLKMEAICSSESYFDFQQTARCFNSRTLLFIITAMRTSNPKTAIQSSVSNYRTFMRVFFDWLYSPCGPWTLFSFLVYSHSVGLLKRVMSSSQGLYLNIGHHKHGINTYTHQTHMP